MAEFTKLPPGWDCKYDQSTGKCYYINYLTRAMQLEDPRIRYKQLQNERCSTESIPLQPLHGSPYHVYPASNFPAFKAFQGPSSQSVSASPLLSAKNQLQMEMSPILRQGSTPQTPHMNNFQRRQTIQETSFTNPSDTDAVVAKINNMFPTASENHIRLLLKKYLKSIFPKADETLLLDILANADNNVQKASETLIAMGYTKREMAAAPKISNRTANNITEQRKGKESTEGKIIPLHPKVISANEKIEIKVRLQKRYNTIEERIILMALESVNYSEDRASQILKIVLQEDESKAKKENKVEENKIENVAEQQEPNILKQRNSLKGSVEEEQHTVVKNEFKSIVGRLVVQGHKPELSKGPDDSLLLADYITWNGANPDISLGRKGLATGSDPGLLSERSYTPIGHDNNLCKGPNTGMAKGSIYSQIKQNITANVKCN